MIISLDTGKPSTKSNTPILKVLERSEIQGKYLNIIKETKTKNNWRNHRSWLQAEQHGSNDKTCLVS